MEAIVNRLFDLAHCEQDKIPVHTEDVALAPLAQEAWRPFNAKARDKRLRVRLGVPTELQVQTDRVWLGAILGNLSSNAAEYTPTDGEVFVHLQTAGPRYSLRVANTVEHLDPEDVPHLFERFWRKDPARSSPEHCGLGLSVSQAFARQLSCCLDASLNGNRTLVLTLSGLRA